MGKSGKSQIKDRKEEQECLKHIWRILKDLRYELDNSPVIGRTKKTQQLNWFDRVYGYIMELKTASDCKKHAKALDTLADAIARRIGPKRELRPSFDKEVDETFSSEVVIEPDEKKQLLERVEKTARSIQRRMKNLHIDIADTSPPTINIKTGGTKWFYVIGVVSLYPAMFATLAREMELQMIAPALSIIGAIMSFAFFVEIAAVFTARPFWVFDPKAAGKITYEIVDRGLWGVALLIPIALIIMQGRWLLDGLWTLIVPIDPIGYGLMVSIVIAIVGLLYYLTKWRYNQYLYCPVCGFKAISHDALNVHCKNKYNYTLKEIVQSSLDMMGAKDLTREERRSNTFLGMGAFYLIVVVFSYIQDQNIQRFFFFLAFCGFFLVLDFLQADYFSYKNEKESMSEEQRQLNSDATTLSIFTFAYIIITSSVVSLFFLSIQSYFALPFDPLIMSATYNTGFGVFLSLASMKATLRGFVRGGRWSSLPISWRNVISCSLVVYSTNLLIGYWAYTVIAITETFFLFGQLAGLVLAILCVREIWFRLRESDG